MKPGDEILIKTKEREYQGLLMPGQKGILVLKLESGYNIGISEKKIKSKKLIKKYSEPKSASSKVKQTKGLKKITILHTGGTIASKVDYKTGGVIARYSPAELLSMFPEIKELANVDSRLISNMWSEDIRFAHYNILAKEIAKEIKKDAKAVIVTHGTDTLHCTAAALSFMLENCPIPVILVGAQRSSDRPSSDAAINMQGAVIFATSTDFRGVAIAMHESSNGFNVTILPGANTKKMHSSRRDAFEATNATPLALVDVIKQSVTDEGFCNPEGKFKILPFNETIKVGVCKIHPNLYASQILAFKGFKGIIIEGTGLGHAPITKVDKHTGENEKIAKAIKKLCKDGTVVAMTTNTVYGRTDLNVYSTGRDLQTYGVIGNYCSMNTDVAFIKLAWLLSNFTADETKELYHENLRGELPLREGIDE
jgi:glutamyl-tRNA(Gln) amidotransferase subunit D